MAENASPSLPDGTYRGHTLIVFTAIFIPVQFLAVSLRYWARWMLRAWGFDDYIILVSLLMQIIIGMLCIEAVNHAGVGLHVPYLEATDPEKLIIWGRYLVTLSVLYFAGVNVPKLAILALYHRLFPNPNIRMVIYGLAAALIGLSISTVIVDLVACRPFKANWETTLADKTCIDKEAFFIWGGVPNIITDVVMLLLPMPVVWKLHTTMRLKIVLTITFAVGSFGLV
ncbi:hypothetical protein VTN77DRAFT_458 [Rasamsonia byssochlamydoides]|uniref:uncharacterized protein n=1 Tax=Rasamsonia byssochlamydoides TaxID=89139 RepID=UPI003742DA60